LVRCLMMLNPAAHGGRAAALQPELVAACQRRGLQVTVHVTGAPGEAIERIGNIEAGEYDAVLSAGGDGTLFEVVNGVMAHPEAARPTIGIVPLGTGNAFVRDLGLAPGALEAALDLLAAGKLRSVDVVEVRCEGDGFFFINMLGLGFIVDAANTAQRLKRLGRAAYTLGALARLVSMPVYTLSLWLDDEPWVFGAAGTGSGAPGKHQVEVLFLEIANSRYTGTHFLMAPDAQIDDGLLDVVVARTLSRRRALRLFPTIYEGRHVDVEEVSVRRAKRVRIETRFPLPALVDGEFRGMTPMTVSCLPGALQLFA
ncbi:MAG: diacylglycerol kinase family protein, partial [Pseudomonadota bacterium]